MSKFLKNPDLPGVLSNAADHRRLVVHFLCLAKCGTRSGKLQSGE